jgi:hypothetical protein
MAGSLGAQRKTCNPAEIFDKVLRMSEVVYVSNVRIERKKGPLRHAYLPGESEPVVFSVHGGIAKHYGVDESKLGQPHAATLDYVVAAAGG